MIVGAMLAALALSGCAVSDDNVGTLLVSPSKYQLYKCPQLKQAAEANVAQQRKLEGLMAKAGTSADGRLVSDMAYRPDYLVARGEMTDLRKAARERNCDFVPGEGALPPPPAGAR